jgi:hypothetical protein
MGIKDDINSFQFSLIFRVGPTPDEYYVKSIYSSDSVIATTSFCGFYTGIDYGRTIFSSVRSEIQVLAGVGVDFCSPWDDRLGGENSVSYNFNLGMGYRYYFENRTYLGIEPKYNFVDYTLNGATFLKGNYASIRLVYGFIDNRIFGIPPHQKRRHH